MEKNFIDITSNISSNLKVLRRDIPDAMASFSALAQAATRSGALDKTLWRSASPRTVRAVSAFMPKL